MIEEPLTRTRLLLGDAAVARLQSAYVAVIGLGGVGGAAAEALARTGVGRLFLVDADKVAPSNLNRQLVAQKSTLGVNKAVAMAERVHAVSDAVVEISEAFISPENVEDILPQGLDFIVDAIDSVYGKAALANFANQHGVPIIACMGAGNRLDPGKLVVTDLFLTEGDPLARKLRQILRKQGVERLPVVFSTEKPHVEKGQTTIGSFMPVTAAAGLTAASYVIKCLSGGE